VVSETRADGEAVGGFPNWQERVMLEWTNRARSEPSVEMASCGSSCGDGFCYSPIPPLSWSLAFNRAARFHADEQDQQGYFAHNSHCTVVSNIDSIYPATCQGQATCACVGGVSTCNPTCTDPQARAALFGGTMTGEIISSAADPVTAFYSLLYEIYQPPLGWVSQYNQSNGHRWLLLKATPAVGFGSVGDTVGDFGLGPSPGKIPSGAHYPQQGSTIEFRTNWYDAAGPQSAWLNLDGTCVAMTLERGSVTNGAWHAQGSSLPSSYVRYVFEFVDSLGNPITFPTTGSFGVPNGIGSCLDWDSTRPASCISYIFSNGFESGNTNDWDSTAP